MKNPTDYLEDGSIIDDFLDDFPSVTREQVMAFLEIRSTTSRHDS